MNIFKTISKDGTRYICQIVVDRSMVKFTGQSDSSMSCALKELAPYGISY